MDNIDDNYQTSIEVQKPNKSSNTSLSEWFDEIIKNDTISTQHDSNDNDWILTLNKKDQQSDDAWNDLFD